MSRRCIAAANWKMNTTPSEGAALATSLAQSSFDRHAEMILAVPATHLDRVSGCISENSQIHLAAQNLWSEPKGAFTGEISAHMLLDLGVEYVLVGHSERRQIFNEDSSVLVKKINAAFEAGLKVIYCCGEPLEAREANEQKYYVNGQLSRELSSLSHENMAHLIIAYEPIWAIGTGLTASPEQAQDMHEAIRLFLDTTFGAIISQNMSILYGGSVKANNAASIFSQKDVDGGLVGGASLNAESFIAIANSFLN